MNFHVYHRSDSNKKLIFLMVIGIIKYIYINTLQLSMNNLHIKMKSRQFFYLPRFHQRYHFFFFPFGANCFSKSATLAVSSSFSFASSSFSFVSPST